MRRSLTETIASAPGVAPVVTMDTLKAKLRRCTLPGAGELSLTFMNLDATRCAQLWRTPQRKAARGKTMYGRSVSDWLPLAEMDQILDVLVHWGRALDDDSVARRA